MIISNDPIHYIKKTKKLAKEIRKQLEEYHDKNRFLTWNKNKRKFVLKRFRK